MIRFNKLFYDMKRDVALKLKAFMKLPNNKSREDIDKLFLLINLHLFNHKIFVF